LEPLCLKFVSRNTIGKFHSAQRLLVKPRVVFISSLSLYLVTFHESMNIASTVLLVIILAVNSPDVSRTVVHSFSDKDVSSRHRRRIASTLFIALTILYTAVSLLDFVNNYTWNNVRYFPIVFGLQIPYLGSSLRQGFVDQLGDDAVERYNNAQYAEASSIYYLAYKMSGGQNYGMLEWAAHSLYNASQTETINEPLQTVYQRIQVWAHRVQQNEPTYALSYFDLGCVLVQNASRSQADYHEPSIKYLRQAISFAFDDPYLVSRNQDNFDFRHYLVGDAWYYLAKVYYYSGDKTGATAAILHAQPVTPYLDTDYSVLRQALVKTS